MRGRSASSRWPRPSKPARLYLPLGAGGTVAVYTREFKPVQIITKVVIRMKRWLSYVIPS